MAPKQLLLATSNAGKVIEFRKLLPDHNWQLLVLADLTQTLEVPEETGATYTENAQLKARYYAELSQLPTIADDSGYSILALDGFPGVQSARWLPGADFDRVNGLLALLEARGLTEPLQRRVCFTCVVSLAQPSVDKTTEFTGECWGTFSHIPLGTNGFGYDPIFIPDGYSATMSQLGTDEKNMISARSIAFRQLAKWLQRQ